MLLRIILFIGAALVILGGSGWVIFRSFSQWFLLSPAGNVVLVLVIAGTLVGFFGTSVLARFSEGVLAKYLYTAFAVLAGIYVFVFFAAILGWIIVWLSHTAGVAVNGKMLGAALVALAVAYSGYNIWNASNIQIVNINVRIPNLPLAWKGKTILQLSDVHLGHILGPRFLEAVVQKANAQHPDVVAITGDLFDGMDGDMSSFVQPLNDLQAKQGIYFITGNHELYLGIDKALRVLKQTKIQYLDNTIVHDNGLQIIGIAYGQDFEAQDITKIITAQPNYDPHMPSVLLYHVPLPSQIAAAKALGIGLQLSGHTHAGQLLPFRPITSIVYGGYDYGLHRDGDFTEYASSGVGTWGPPMRSGAAPEIVVVHLE